MIEPPHIWEPPYSNDNWKINYERLYSKPVRRYKRERSLACVAEIAVFMQYIFFSMHIYLSAAVNSFSVFSAAYIHLGPHTLYMYWREIPVKQILAFQVCFGGEAGTRIS